MFTLRKADDGMGHKLTFFNLCKNAIDFPFYTVVTFFDFLSLSSLYALYAHDHINKQVKTKRKKGNIRKCLTHCKITHKI